jgi:putative ABC transport system permease protein
MADDPDADPRRATRHRVLGLVELSLRRIADSLRRRRPSRALVVIGVVAVAVAVLVVVTGLSLGLATQPAVGDSGAEYWIAPESAGALTTLTAADGPRLGDVHATSADLERNDDVVRATPVLLDVLEIRTSPSRPAEYILAVGVVAAEDGGEVAGLSTAPLTAGDPYYADGGYDGGFTGEVVLSPAAANLLAAARGDSLLISRPGPSAVDQSFAVTHVQADDGRVRNDAPVALFQLAELQAFTGADAGDQADQILVDVRSESAVPALEAAYPDATVVERGTVSPDRVADSEMPLAVALSALLVVFVVTALVVATAAGIDVEADRQRLAVLSALGYARGSTTGLVAIRTLALAALGGLAGSLLGAAGILLLNRVVAPAYDLGAVAVLSPALVAYGVGVAVLAGLLAVPYPVVLARRTVARRELTR